MSSAPNPAIVSLLTSLQQQHQALATQMETVEDPAVAAALVQEGAEILARINAAQNAMFVEVAATLTAAVAAVGTADKQLTEDLAAVTKADDVINAVSKYLGWADQAIAIAKGL